MPPIFHLSEGTDEVINNCKGNVAGGKRDGQKWSSHMDFVIFSSQLDVLNLKTILPEKEHHTVFA